MCLTASVCCAVHGESDLLSASHFMVISAPMVEDFYTISET